MGELRGDSSWHHIFMNKNFKGQLDDEQVICFFRKHWIDVMRPLLSLLATFPLTVVGFLIAVNNNHTLDGDLVMTGFILINILLLYAMHRAFLDIFHYYLHTVIITNYRVVEVDKSVFFKDEQNSTDLDKIQDVKKSQDGFLANIFDFGTLTIVLAGSHSETHINAVPNSDYFFKQIHNVKQSYWTRNHQRLETANMPAEAVWNQAEEKPPQVNMGL